MVYRIYVEKKKEFAQEAAALLHTIQNLLQIENLKALRILQRYDVEQKEGESMESYRTTVFSEPQLDLTYSELPKGADSVFATEYLPGQYDQRADSCAQCIQFVSQGERPLVRTAKIFLLFGQLTEAEQQTIKKYVINPVESREASLEIPVTLLQHYDIPKEVKTLKGFIELDRVGLEVFLQKHALAMDFDDIEFCQAYFRKEDRDPTLTEIRMIDTYWSDHCRHTTFSTILEEIKFEDKALFQSYQDFLEDRKEIHRNKPVTLMELATMGARYLKTKGYLDKLDESEEINACTVKVEVEIEGKTEEWLYLFKNETHNHPTEIEPFGGAATCIGGAIRDPLSGRAYVYQAMRVTGAANPLLPIAQTILGKLPQRTIVTTAAAGYSSYGNQIGLATGLVDEIYHPGYVAKRMEIGAVVGAVPKDHVRREVPEPGDIVVLLGGRTGRDGCGGATGSSKSHKISSLEECGAEVQKGNAPEERKLQRLFRNREAASMIKRCNDFGAGGVSVAIGELAEGLIIDLNAVPKKYEGLDGTELAISESQERMAVVLEQKDQEAFFALAKKENLEATKVAVITEEKRLIMKWNDSTIVDISREFLDSNGAKKRVNVLVEKGNLQKREWNQSFEIHYKELVTDLNVCSKQGLAERFDSTIGASTVFMPFGGKNQKTPTQVMAAKFPVEGKETKTCSLMSYGFNPFLSEQSPYDGAFLAVIESVSKLVAAGASLEDCYLTFQEYFERLNMEPKRWGKPLAALLGAYRAQIGLKLAAIGGKDSMSGSFEDIHVPPTLVSFATAVTKIDDLISPEFKKSDSLIVFLKPKQGADGRIDTEDLLLKFVKIRAAIQEKKVVSAYTPGFGGIAEAIFKMAIGNGIGFAYDKILNLSQLFDYHYGSFLLEFEEKEQAIAFCTDFSPGEAILLGETTTAKELSYDGHVLNLDELSTLYEKKLEPVFPCTIPVSYEEENRKKDVKAYYYTEHSMKKPQKSKQKPKVLIPVFPGTNCEYDTAKAFLQAGAEPEILVVKNLTQNMLLDSINLFAKKIAESQIIALPGGFSGGDEPDGSAKFILSFFRNPKLKEAVQDLLKNRDGLMCGICNGFQALVKLGLLPFGEISDTTENSPTLTFNQIGRHQSKICFTRVASVKSPWLTGCEAGDIHATVISHGEGRFVCKEDLLSTLAANGQIATQYVDQTGVPTMDIDWNPNGSDGAVEGLFSPDGRIFGKMGHSERIGDQLYKNVPGNYSNRMFESAVRYFS